MKTIMRSAYFALAIAILSANTRVTNAAPGDLIAPDYNGNVFALPTNPFGTASLYWDNTNLPPHSWVGCAFDGEGNLYLLEQPGCNNCGNIYKLSPDRTSLTLFATGLANTATELAVDGAGNVYEAEEDSNCNVSVYRFDPQGVRSTFATITGNPDDCDGSAGFGSMAFDSQGNLFLSSGQYSVPPLAIARIYKITPQGQASVFVDLRYGYTTIGLALDDSDNVFVLAVYSYSFPMQQRLFVYTSSGGEPSIFGGVHDNNECGVGSQSHQQPFVIDNTSSVYLTTTPATITQYPPTYDCEDPATLPHVYIGNGWDPYETLGQLAIEPAVPTPTATATATATATFTPTATATFTPTATATPTSTPHGHKATPTPTPTATPTATPTPAPTPAAPAALAATDVTASSFTANWSGVNGAIGYRLDVSTKQSFNTYVPGYQDLSVGNTTSYDVKGLNANTNYYYRLRANNVNGTSPNSNVITVKTARR